MLCTLEWNGPRHGLPFVLTELSFPAEVEQKSELTYFCTVNIPVQQHCMGRHRAALPPASEIYPVTEATSLHSLTCVHYYHDIIPHIVTNDDVMLSIGQHSIQKMGGIPCTHGLTNQIQQNCTQLLPWLYSTDIVQCHVCTYCKCSSCTTSPQLLLGSMVIPTGL